jgi:hypothetical protein
MFLSNMIDVGGMDVVDFEKLSELEKFYIGVFSINLVCIRFLICSCGSDKVFLNIKQIFI